MLTEREFNLMLLLMEEKSILSQRQAADALSCSLGTINKLFKDLSERGYIDAGHITSEGIAALEPYRVKRAIFIAAGFGSRLAPITLNTPKPLIRVNGKRIIDTLLDAVIAAGIHEIVIVRGYLGEQFDQLLYKYPQIKFADNPNFNEYNNIASAMCVRHLFENAYVMDADLIIRNPKIIRSYEYQSNLLCEAVDRTDDWCVKTDKNGFVDSVAVGGLNAYREIGISYWTAEDGAKLSADIKDVYESPGGKERFWEQVPLMYKKKNYHVAVRECAADDVAEVDTFSELKMLDKSYDI